MEYIEKYRQVQSIAKQVHIDRVERLGLVKLHDEAVSTPDELMSTSTLK